MESFFGFVTAPPIGITVGNHSFFGHGTLWMGYDLRYTICLPTKNR